jgi:hypothetical protein
MHGRPVDVFFYLDCYICIFYVRQYYPYLWWFLSSLGDLVAITCLVYPGALLSSKTDVMFVEEKGRDKFARVSF